jgi:hypothetical protein
MRPLVFALLILIISPLHADGEGRNVFFAPFTEVSGYGRVFPSYGGGFAIGASEDISIGARFLYTSSLDADDVGIVEMTVFSRFFFFNKVPCTGLFLQANAGLSIYARKDTSTFGDSALVFTPSFAAGLGVGYRFKMGRRMYFEPVIRGGYPFLFGAGASVAIDLYKEKI